MHLLKNTHTFLPLASLILLRLGFLICKVGIMLYLAIGLYENAHTDKSLSHMSPGYRLTAMLVTNSNGVKKTEKLNEKRNKEGRTCPFWGWWRRSLLQMSGRAQPETSGRVQNERDPEPGHVRKGKRGEPGG